MKISISFFLLLSLLLAFSFSATNHCASPPTAGLEPTVIDSSQNVSSEVEQRIRRIENSLLLPVIVKGEPSVPMKLADRMQFYKTPGVSIAFINNGRIEWARGYGVREVGSRQS
jgi:CubicO group peptidase (beta-lactamase class C family)